MFLAKCFLSCKNIKYHCYEHYSYPALRSHRGRLAGFFVVKDKGGLIWNIIIGLLGGLVGGWLLGKLGASGSFWSQWYGQIMCALIGAVVLLWVWNLIKKLLK